VRRSSGFFGLVGVGLLLFALILLAFTRGAGAFDVLVILVHLIGGIACIVVYLSSGLENLREFLGERSTRYGTSTILASLFFVGILAALNFLSTRYNARWDMTESGAYSLSQQTTNVLRGLDEELTMEAFVERGRNPLVEDLLRRYADTSSEVSYRMIDPDRQPELAERYEIRQYNTVRLGYGDQSTAVVEPTEETLTNAVIKLTRDSELTVCAVSGHGEPAMDDKETASGYALAAAAIENENYKLETILLPSLEEVPETCAVVMIAGPQRPFLEHELAALDRFVRSGGSLLALVAPRQAPQLVEFLERWGIDVGDDVVVDQVVRLFQGPSLGLSPLVDEYDANHEITRDLRERSLFPLVRSVTSVENPQQAIGVTELVKSSPSSWAETDVAGVFESGTAALDAADRRGPISIAAAAEIGLAELDEPGEGEARLVVIGSVEFADNQNLEGTFFNRDLFLNSIGWLAGESDLLSIRPRAVRASRVSFTRDEGTLIFYLSVLVIPELLLMLGLYVWWRRN
jgi:ABC-type uncharacterized transport system involved in gliding motility auxiliary subunit